MEIVLIFRIVECFPRCSNTFRDRARQHVEEQENILEMVERSPTTSTRKLSTRLGVSRTRVWRTLHEDVITNSVCKIYTQGTVPCV